MAWLLCSMYVLPNVAYASRQHEEVVAAELLEHGVDSPRVLVYYAPKVSKKTFKKA